MAAKARPKRVFIISGLPNVSATQPISMGDQMSPRKWTAKIETA